MCNDVWVSRNWLPRSLKAFRSSLKFPRLVVRHAPGAHPFRCGTHSLSEDACVRGNTGFAGLAWKLRELREEVKLRPRNSLVLSPLRATGAVGPVRVGQIITVDSCKSTFPASPHPPHHRSPLSTWATAAANRKFGAREGERKQERGPAVWLSVENAPAVVYRLRRLLCLLFARVVLRISMAELRSVYPGRSREGPMQKTFTPPPEGKTGAEAKILALLNPNGVGQVLVEEIPRDANGRLHIKSLESDVSLPSVDSRALPLLFPGGHENVRSAINLRNHPDEKLAKSVEAPLGDKD
ncbi:hypothetical protein B0H16DRAFT_1700174 [Mycena metata]|uniref:Uncharacterized protein n=1 Tax=Mycena metata TaxID=1033252 RepID=A0AAD7HG50_9AGAR|nr:hypothetical protein B0H16DRAFT_1700174 [Mycena metata]